MTSIPTRAQAAIDLARRGEIEQAIVAAQEAITYHPGDLGLRIFIAMLHLRRNELAEALPHLRAAHASDPREALAKVELIRVLVGLGELDEAAALLDGGGVPSLEFLRLRASLMLRQGNITDAVGAYRQIVSADAHDFESWGKLGHSLLAAGQADQAAEAYAKSLALRPEQVAIRLKLAEARYLSGSGEGALRELTALSRTPQSDSDLWVVIAHLQNLLGREQESFAASEEALRQNPKSAEALIAVAEALERRNDLVRLGGILGELERLGQRTDRLAILKARLALRRGEYEVSLRLARSAPSSADPATKYQLIAQSLDRSGDSDGAFRAFLEMNAEDARTSGPTDRLAEEARASLVEERELLTRQWLESWRPADPTLDRQVAFLVGFPRSGTTLLDTFLMGHPGLAVAEEEPMLAEVDERLGSSANIAELSPDEVQNLRRLYFDKADRLIPDAAGRLLLDKNPFVMGSQAIVRRLFPEAPIIFMERHPCDVVLSCFMTRFQPTGLGANFVTLRDSALLYHEMMELWERSTEVLGLNVRRVRYERLVDDAERELRPLVEFLDLEWLPALLDHISTARKRAFIRTPSYSQVTQPVTPKAVGRWTRYRSQLAPVLPILEPWAKKMGYQV